MQPYQEASQEIGRQGRLPLDIAKTAGSFLGSAAAAYTGAGAINRVLPFLNKYIPEDLVKKGLSKIDPRYGKFIDTALSNGESIESAKDFIKDKIEESPEFNQEKTKEKRNIIEQESPELHQFIDQEIRKGRKPIEAAAIAQNDSKFSQVVKKLMNKHKTPWSSIVESIFGNGDQALNQQNQQSTNMLQQNQTSLNPAIQAALQKIMQM